MTGKLPINLDHLLRQHNIEGGRIDYKAGWNPQRVLHTICAFANDFHNLGGGYVVLGVDEQDGRPLLPPKGIDPARIDRIQNELLNLGHSAIQPQYHPLTATYRVEGRTIFVLWEPGGETRPYKARVNLSRGGTGWAYYIRRHSSTVRARGPDERELLGLAATVPFDDRYHQSASLEDLSLRLIEQHLKDIGSDLAPEAANLSIAELGQRLNIVGGPPEALFPKNVGLMFFNDRPHDFFPATQIDVVWFPDGPGGDRSIRMEDFRKGQAVSRRYRNRRIGEFLKELDLAEARSTGVPKIFRAMRQNGSPEPIFESDDDRTWFLVRLPVHERASPAATEHETDPTYQVTDQDTDQVTGHVKQLVNALTDEMRRSELQAALQLRHRRHFTTTYLHPAITAGLIEMTLPDKPSSQYQRYRRTAQGEALAEKIKKKHTSK